MFPFNNGPPWPFFFPHPFSHLLPPLPALFRNRSKTSCQKGSFLGFAGSHPWGNEHGYLKVGEEKSELLGKRKRWPSRQHYTGRCLGGPPPLSFPVLALPSPSTPRPYLGSGIIICLLDLAALLWPLPFLLCLPSCAWASTFLNHFISFQIALQKVWLNLYSTSIIAGPVLVVKSLGSFLPSFLLSSSLLLFLPFSSVFLSLCSCCRCCVPERESHCPN